MEKMEVKKRILGIDISNYCYDNTGFTYIGVRTGHFITSQVKGIMLNTTKGRTKLLE